MKEQPIHTLIDLSHPIIDRMQVYPGDEPVQLKKSMILCGMGSTISVSQAACMLARISTD